MDLIKFPIPSDLLASYARWWFGDKADFVLNEEVSEWIGEQDIRVQVKALHLRHKEPTFDSDIQYEIIFECVRDATLFKLRWF